MGDEAAGEGRRDHGYFEAEDRRTSSERMGEISSSILLPRQRSHRFLFSTAKPAAEVAARTSWGGERGCRVVDREDAREACKDLLTPICGEWSQVPEI